MAIINKKNITTSDIKAEARSTMIAGESITAQFSAAAFYGRWWGVASRLGIVTIIWTKGIGRPFVSRLCAMGQRRLRRGPELDVRSSAYQPSCRGHASESLDYTSAPTVRLVCSWHQEADGRLSCSWQHMSASKPELVRPDCGFRSVDVSIYSGVPIDPLYPEDCSPQHRIEAT